ncbi:hypothetical protein Tco_1156435 [Tanacetum coccineum]
MNDPNITMVEYIRLEEEKAQKHGKVFDWETAKYDMAPLPSCEQRHPFLRYQGLEYTDAHIADFEERMVMEHRDDAGGSGRRLSWRQFILALGLHTGEEIESLSFVRYSKILRGLTVIAPELPIIDMAELVRLQICKQLDDTWVWVTIEPERQPNAAAGAPGVAQDAPVIDEGGQAILTPIHAPPLPPPVAARTMPQRMARLKEDVREIRRVLTEQQEVIYAMAHDFSRFYT